MKFLSETGEAAVRSVGNTIKTCEQTLMESNLNLIPEAVSRTVNCESPARREDNIV